MKKNIMILILSIICLLFGGFISYLVFNPTEKYDPLPKPEVTGGERVMLGIDKNINEETIDKYLGRDDSVYRDMRMLIDPGNYSAIGGDSYLSGLVSGFEVVPYPLLTEVKGLPEAVGDSYKGKTLFTQDENGTYKIKDNAEFYKVDNRVRKVWEVKIYYDYYNEYYQERYVYYVDATTGEIIGGNRWNGSNEQVAQLMEDQYNLIEK